MLTKIFPTIIYIIMIHSVLNNEIFELEKLLKINKEKNLKGLLTENCWIDAYGRGVGGAIHACTGDFPDKSGLLCYPKCKDGFYGLGPVCWQNCPADFRDDGAYCYKQKSAYGRGVGYISESKCKSEHQDTGCEKNGLLWYPKCRAGYHNVGCCICSADCPSGMTDIGISCQKQSYGRGVGRPLGCSETEDYQAGLCYQAKCKNNYTSIGPVCWGHCPSIWPKAEFCFGLCLQNSTCAGQIREWASDISKIAEDYANKNTIGVIIDIAKLIQDTVFDKCDKYSALEFINGNIN